MKIIIKGRHIEITDALRNYLEKKLNKIENRFDNILEITAALRIEKKRPIVEITLHANKALIRVEEETEDMYASIDKVIDKLDRKIKKYKEKYLAKPHVTTGKKEALENKSNIEEKTLDDDYKIVKTKKFAIKPMSVE